MLKLNDKSKKKYHTNIKRGTFEMPLFVFDGLNLNHAIDESQFFLHQCQFVASALDLVGKFFDQALGIT